MKYYFAILLVVTTSLANCQTCVIKGNVRDSLTNQPAQWVGLVFKKDNIAVAATATDSTGNYLLKNIKPGVYNLSVTAVGYKDENIDSISIKSDSTITFNIFFPAPCHQIRQEHPVCIGGHTDHIIPVVYGFPGKKMMRQARKGKIWLGGCIRYGCDPRYYCTIHKKELF